MYRPGRKTLIYTAAALLILAVVFFIKTCGKSDEKIYVFDSISKGDVKKTIAVTGELDVVNPITILSKLNGIITNTYTDFNQKVSKGQLLLKIDSTAIDQKIQRISGQLESMRLEALSAQADLDGKKNLFKDNLISRRALEQAEINYKGIMSKYNQIKLDYEQAREEKNSANIHSPINGIVINMYRDKNQAVAVNTPLFLLAENLKKMVLTINVDESDIGFIKIGQGVIFTVSAFPEKRFTGKIEQVRINPVKSGSLVSYQSIVICDNDELLLKPGMTATATVVIDEKKDVIRVLNQAFMVTPDDNEISGSSKGKIWIKSGIVGKPYKGIEVKTGLSGDLYTEIISGLSGDEEVLIRIKGK